MYCSHNLLELLDLLQLLSLLKHGIVQSVFLPMPSLLQRLNIGGTPLLHLGNSPEELFESILALVRSEDRVLEESNSALMIIQRTNVVKELLLVLGALFNDWSHQILHGPSQFRLEDKLVGILILGVERDLVGDLADCLVDHALDLCSGHLVLGILC